ncbi:MAG: DNA-binding response regulator [Acidobacteria bacterium]|nr:MAG: DNA-binding response regulator [Acidobacteriota bacterium]
MDDRKKILAVDDEPQILRVLRQILNAHGYAVQAAQDGASALEVFKKWSPDLVLTDLQMPEMDGLRLCKELRAVSDVPIVILSVRSEEEKIVEALDTGADDYITKPFGTNELLARLRSAFRRAPAKETSLIDSGPFRIDITAHTAKMNSKDVRLTPKEFDLLVCFLRNPDRVLTHSFLLQKVWGSYYAGQFEALRVLVGSLRKKIEADPSNPQFIQTEPWIGYRFVSI